MFSAMAPAGAVENQEREFRRSRAVRRRPTPEQGRALEMLGHAVEYVVDSRLYLPAGGAELSDELAVQLLMRLSREVFAECAQVVPLRRRLRWIARWMRLPG